jgi:hypothetical protein
MDIKAIIPQLTDFFGIEGDISCVRKIENGHINDTYSVTVGGTEYIFQRVNNYVFKEPEIVMKNIKQVSDYIRGSSKKGVCGIIDFHTGKNGLNYTKDDDGGLWRVCKFVCNSVTFDVVEDPAILKNSGYAFGDFLNTLADMPIGNLYVTIPDFHNTRKRFDDFFDMVEKDPLGRVGGIQKEIEVFAQYRSFCRKLTDMSESGQIPLRPVHNDTKYNNILLDKTTLKPVCVIDLDTIMPGLAAHDFGDAVRFACNSAAEDEQDLGKVGLNMDYYKEFTSGFMEAAASFLKPAELDTLVYGAPTITFELASRFLLDYINGDLYFKIHRPLHNLERARCQLALAIDMMDKLDAMKKITG